MNWFSEDMNWTEPMSNNISRRFAYTLEVVKDRKSEVRPMADQDLVDSLNAEIARLKGELAVAGKRILELEDLLVQGETGDKKPWELEGISERAWYKRKQKEKKVSRS